MPKNITPLSISHPALVDYWDEDRNKAEGRSFSETPAGTAYKAYWTHQHTETLPNGELWSGEHSWRRTPRVQINADKSCSICAGRHLLEEYNDLATRSPELVQEWDYIKNKGFTPSGILFNSNTKVWWLCSKHGHSWFATVSSRATRGRGCPICNNSQILTGYNDLKTTHSQLAEEYRDDLNEKPSTLIGAGHHGKVWWECPIDSEHVYDMSIDKRTQRGQGCPHCANKRITPGKNDLASNYVELMEEWDYSKNKIIANPSKISPGADIEVWWKCVKGHEWKALIYNRTGSKNQQCPACTGKTVYVGYNDLSTTDPELLKTWNNDLNTIKPEEISRGSDTLIWWYCNKNKKHPSYKTTILKQVERSKVGCPRCSAESQQSNIEKELIDYLKGALPKLDIQTSCRKTIKPYELDIYIPEKNVAIEFNGLYWHSEAAGKNKWYHHNKYKNCQEKGIQLIQIWEDDWNERKEFIKLALLHKLQEADPSLRIGARKLTPTQINYQQSSEFLNKNHIQGDIQGSYYYALSAKTTQNDIKAVLVIKKVGNKGHEGEWRIERYATSCPVPGGFTKLLKYAEKEAAAVNENITKWVTFSDNCISDGGLYSNNGFTKDSELEPDYKYVKNGKRHHKFNYRLKRFREDPTLKWEENLSESQLAQLNNLHRIWDAGKIRWIKQVTTLN